MNEETPDAVRTPLVTEGTSAAVHNHTLLPVAVRVTALPVVLPVVLHAELPGVLHAELPVVPEKAAVRTSLVTEETPAVVRTSLVTGETSAVVRTLLVTEERTSAEALFETSVEETI